MTHQIPREKNYKGTPVFYAKSRKHWRNWLIKNHQKVPSVWLIMFHKRSSIRGIYYPEAVEEALCFGWIDSKPNKRDAISYYQFFSNRKPNSVWSALNKKRVAILSETGLMYPAGQEKIDLAKNSGQWTALEESDRLEVPADLSTSFKKDPSAFEHWKKFPPSAKKAILYWIAAAKQSATRENRIIETVEKAALNKRANQYVPKSKRSF